MICTQIARAVAKQLATQQRFEGFDSAHTKCVHPAMTCAPQLGKCRQCRDCNVRASCDYGHTATYNASTILRLKLLKLWKLFKMLTVLIVFEAFETWEALGAFKPSDNFKACKAFETFRRHVTPIFHSSFHFNRVRLPNLCNPCKPPPSHISFVDFNPPTMLVVFCLAPHYNRFGRSYNTCPWNPANSLPPWVILIYSSIRLFSL